MDGSIQVVWSIFACIIYINVYIVYYIFCIHYHSRYIVYIYLDVSENCGTPKNPKMIIFSRKTHGCWVPLFLETPICTCPTSTLPETWTELKNDHGAFGQSTTSMRSRLRRFHMDLSSEFHHQNGWKLIVDHMPPTHEKSKYQWTKETDFWRISRSLGWNLENLLILYKISVGGCFPEPGGQSDRLCIRWKSWFIGPLAMTITTWKSKFQHAWKL